MRYQPLRSLCRQRLQLLQSIPLVALKGKQSSQQRRSASHLSSDPLPALGRYAKRSSQQLRCCSGPSCSATDKATPINKQPVALQMSEQLYGYLLEHTREPEVLRQLRRETAETMPVGARMQVSPEQAQFLGWLVGALAVRRAIELGTFTGYSSIAIAQALPDDGRLVACDKDPRCLQLAQQYWQKAGVSHKVDARLGPALNTLNELVAAGEAGTYDFIFIDLVCQLCADADKRASWQYYELALQLVRRGGVIATDNVLWYGRVADPQEQDKKTVAIRDFNHRIFADDRVSLSIVPVGDGMALCTRR